MSYANFTLMELVRLQNSGDEKAKIELARRYPTLKLSERINLSMWSRYRD